MKVVSIKGKKKTEEFEVRDMREKFFMVDDAYLNGWARVCGPYATLVYLTMCRHASKDQLCFPSVALMSDKLGITRRRVMEGIRRLEFYNIIKVVREPGKKSFYWLVDKKHWKKKTVTFTRYMPR
jgi:hypothetical protein